ncbi:MAG: four helix bundle protein [Candidatus Bipolaricaulia bacterium]
MSKIERFEDIRAWGEAREVVNNIYNVTGRGSFAQDFSLKDQIRRAAISIPSNIAEGFSRHSNKEFIQFLFVAKGSAAEVQSQRYTALDQGYISQEEFDNIY